MRPPVDGDGLGNRPSLSASGNGAWRYLVRCWVRKPQLEVANVKHVLDQHDFNSHSQHLQSVDYPNRLNLTCFKLYSLRNPSSDPSQAFFDPSQAFFVDI